MGSIEEFTKIEGDIVTEFDLRSVQSYDDYSDGEKLAFDEEVYICDKCSKVNKLKEIICANCSQPRKDKLKKVINKIERDKIHWFFNAHSDPESKFDWQPVGYELSLQINTFKKDKDKRFLNLRFGVVIDCHYNQIFCKYDKSMVRQLKKTSVKEK